MFDFFCCRNKNNGTLNPTFNCCIKTEVANEPQKEDNRLDRPIYVTVLKQHTKDISLRDCIRGKRIDHFE